MVAIKEDPPFPVDTAAARPYVMTGSSLLPVSMRGRAVAGAEAGAERDYERRGEISHTGNESGADPLQWVSDHGLGVALFYGAISVSITLFNKAVLSSWHFPHSNFLTLAQVAFSGLGLKIGASTGLIPVRRIAREGYSRYSL